MKQKSLLKVFFLLCALIVGSTSLWATDQTLFDVTTASNWETSTNTYSSTVWSSNGCIFVQASNNQKGWSYVRLGGKNLSNVDAYIATTTATTIQTKQLDVTVAQAYSNNALTINSITLYVYETYTSSNKTYTDEIEHISYAVKDYATGTMTFEPSSADYWDSGVYFKLVYNVSNSSTSKNYGTDVSKLVAKEYTGGGGTPTVSTPTFLPAGGTTYTTAQNVELACATDGAIIRYTMTEDGTTPDDPTESDATYESAISVTKSGTKIKAKAFKAEYNASAVATATYTIKPNKPTITGGASVTITGDDGCTFFYTTATGSDSPADPNNESTEYTAPFTPADGTKIKAVAYDAYGNKSDATSVFTFMYMPLNPKNINSNYFVKVTDASTLENGDAILIVCETDKQALSTTQNTNNRGATSVTIDGSGIIENPDNKVQKLILVKKTEKISDVNTDVFYFYTGSAGYLYAASNSSNHLKTEEAPDNNNNARATISISSGDATILFTGTNANKWLKHNYSGTSNLFSCYPTTNTTMDIVQIYKEVVPPTVSGTITEAGWNTFSSNYALDLSTITGGTAYVATTVDNTVVTMTKTTAKIAAGTGIMIKGNAGETFTISTTTDAATLEADNQLVGLPNGGTVAANAYNFVFAWETGDVSTAGFYYVDIAAPTLPAGKAYLNSEGVNGAKLSIVIDDTPSQEETDGIKSVQGSRFTVNGEAYNLAGQKVGANYKGIVIVNGKKVIRK